VIAPGLFKDAPVSPSSQRRPRHTLLPRVAWPSRHLGLPGFRTGSGRNALQAGGIIGRWMTVLTSLDGRSVARGPAWDSGLRAGAYLAARVLAQDRYLASPIPHAVESRVLAVFDGTRCVGFLRYLVQVMAPRRAGPR
jgi:hypothetical protein